ncbi:MAG: reverse transcriptase domain-containing protein [Bacteroidota bacterium]
MDIELVSKTASDRERFYLLEHNAAAIDFLKIATPIELCRLLHIRYSILLKLMSSNGYRCFTIPKKDGGIREIESPGKRLKTVQQNLNYYLRMIYAYMKPKSSHGFVYCHPEDADSRSIISNAWKHCGKKYVMNIDLQDFFHSIKGVRVKELFSGNPFYFPDEVATCLALICCFEKRLPVGAPTSPIIANLICLRLDKSLEKIASQQKMVYTRYADDLSFSSNSPFTKDKIEVIKSCIHQSGFEINTKKFRVQKNTSRQVVTGIKVNRFPNVDRRTIRNLRAVLYHWEKSGIEAASETYFLKHEFHGTDKLESFKLSVSGKINFLRDVRGRNDRVYMKMKEKMDELVWRENS